MSNLPIKELQTKFPEIIRENVNLSKYTACRIGGPADVLLTVSSTAEMVETVKFLNKNNRDYFILGGGSNILISDKGVRGIVILNKAKHIKFGRKSATPTVWAESGSKLIHMARLTAERYFSGLEWAGGIPGTIGGAIYGNAGAHGGDIAGTLISADILLQNNEQVIWNADDFDFKYRSSKLQTSPSTVILSASFKLALGNLKEIEQQMDNNHAVRKNTQPPGASLGSMFKNPPGDYAGRLIDAVGLKGVRIGDAEISPKHANFFINYGGATGNDVFELISFVKEKVSEKFGISLELEIKMIGDW
jgi:UDP-N-acetylmuramate dehydrogenase